MFGNCEISAPVQSAPFDTVAILAGQPAQGDIHRLLATRKPQGQVRLSFSGSIPKSRASGAESRNSGSTISDRS